MLSTHKKSHEKKCNREKKQQENQNNVKSFRSTSKRMPKPIKKKTNCSWNLCCVTNEIVGPFHHAIMRLSNFLRSRATLQHTLIPFVDYISRYFLFFFPRTHNTHTHLLFVCLYKFCFDLILVWVSGFFFRCWNSKSTAWRSFHAIHDKKKPFFLLFLSVKRIMNVVLRMEFLILTTTTTTTFYYYDFHME